MTAAVSVVVPAYREQESIGPVVARLLASIRSDVEVLVVVDDDTDPTAAALAAHVDDPRVRCLVNDYGRGPAHALRYGIDHASTPVVVVTMADGSDDPTQIDDLVALIDGGAVVAAASRYSSGGRQVGAPLLKSTMSRAAGTSLGLLGRVGTYDATNSFKAYSRDFVREVGIDSRSGFEIGLELTVKARRLRRPVAELPTVWRERSAGASRFRLLAWLPRYLRWYVFAYGPRLSMHELRAASARIAAATPQES